jgi:hypothetical protein
MKLLGKKILLKEIKTTENPIAVNPVDHYEVFMIGDEVTKVNIGDSVLYQNGNRAGVMGEDYILTDEESVWLIL